MVMFHVKRAARPESRFGAVVTAPDGARIRRHERAAASH